MGSRNRFEQLSVRSRQGRRLGRLGRAGAGLLLVLGFAGALAPLVQTLTSAPAGAQTNLIQNGSFEAPALPSGTNFDTYPGGSTAITDWTVGANSVDVVGSQYLAPEDGAQSIDLSAGGSVSQNVAGTTAGDTYALSWYVAGDPTCVGDPHPTKTMDVSWNGTLVADPSFNTAGDSPTSPGWAEEQVDVTATGSDTISFADATGGADPCGATLDNVSLVPMDTTDCASSNGFSDNFATDTSLSDCWQTAAPILTPGVPDSDAVNDATSIAPDLSFNGSDMDMQGAAADPEFTGIESAAAYQAPFDFTTTVKAVQSGDNAFVVYLANTTGGGVSLEGDLSSSALAGVWANEAGGYLGAGDDIMSSTQGEVIPGLSNPPLGTTFHISISMDDDGDFSITVNGDSITSATLGRIGNGPFHVILGQRESDDEAPGVNPPPPPTGPNEAAWYSASLTTNNCSPSSFSTDFGLDYELGSVYQGYLQSCWLEEQAPYTGLPPAIGSVETALGVADEPPSLTLESSGSLFSPMQMAGTSGANEFTGIQSADAYPSPFELQTSVQGLVSNGSAFVVYLVNANATEAFTVEGDLNAADGNYGIFADRGIGVTAARQIVAISPNTPATGVTYDITMSVDSAGNGTVTVSYSGGSDTASVGDVGTGPFYAILGQHETSPATPGANVADWFSASLTPGNATVTATLSASSPTVDGVESVPASAVPASSVDSSTGSGGAASAPLDSIPLDSIGLGSAPLDSIPLDSIPLDSIAAPGAGAPSGLATAAQALSETLLSEVGITYPAGCGAPGPACTGWQGVLAGTPYAQEPLESVTLADVVTNATADARFNSVDLGSLDLASSPLDSIPLDSIELGATPLDSIPLATAPGNGEPDTALGAWCTELASLSFPCSDFGISAASGSDNGVTLLTLALAGVPLDSIPLDSIPLDSIPLDSIPLDSIPLDSINLASNPLDSIPLDSINLASNPLDSIPLDSINLASNPLDSIPLDSIPLDSINLVVNCQAYSCTAPGATLGAAAAAGAIVSGATVGDLLAGDTTSAPGYPSLTIAAILNGDNTAVPGYPSLTVGSLLNGDNTTVAGYPELTLEDLILMTTPPSSYPWQSVSLPSLPLAADETIGGTVTYTAHLNAAAPVTVQVTITLPASFAYVPGSTTLDGAAGPAPAQAGCGQSSCSLGWTLALGAGSHSLALQANAGIGLGSAAAALSTDVAGAAGPSSSATVDVVDGETPAVNAASTAPQLAAGTPPSTGGNLNIGYLTSPGDLNDWQVTVSQGQELSLALTNLPASYDLELFGPNSAQLQGTPSQDLSGVTDELPSVTPGGTTEPTPGSQDIPVTPPPGDQLEAVANNPDGQDQYIQTTPLAAGTYLVQVSGYNGAYSSQPYLLRANLLGGATAPSCPGGISYPNAMPAAASGPVTVPTGANTLFLVDTQRLSAAFGSSAESTIMSDLQQVASDSAAGVNGAVIPVDAYSSVQNAYSVWNENPCSVSGANGVVAAIASIVDQIRADNPTVQNLVVVGADDQIPFARLADGATQSNERDYGASAAIGQSNVEADALSLGYYFSDDPYAASQPLGVGSATLYTPQLAVGRLVESASEIESALTRFVTSKGDLNATASLTTGYSFLTSGAQAVEANLAADGLTPSALINESWTESNLDSALTASPTPGIDSLNAHFDYSRALPAYDNANNLTTNLFTTTDIRNALSSYAGRLLFSMGCHSGLDVDDAEVDASIGATAPIDDWAKTFADAGALWVANTGYGYADTDTIAYSAKLMAEFAGDLNGSLTIGQALTEAKQQYAAGNAILSPYDLKALMESTFYGLPMYYLNKPPTPVAPPSGPATGTDPITGLTDAPVSAALPTGGGAGDLGLVSTSNGEYYEVNGAADGGTQATEYRPIEPLATYPVTEPGLLPHGALITGLASTDVADPTPAYSLPAAGSAGATPPAIGEAAFPGTLQRVATYGTFTASGTGQGAQLDLVAGQFLPSSPSSGGGTERLFTSMTAKVFYLPPSSQYADDYTPPTIDSTQAVTSPSGLDFAVQVAPSSAPVDEVLVLYTDGLNPGTWQSETLSLSSGQTWTGNVPATPSGQVQYFVEAVDAAGNVAVSNNEGTAFNAVAEPAITISLSGNGPTNGYYTGPVTADITAPSGSTYVLDGSQPAVLPTTGDVVVSTAGEHTLTVTNPSDQTATQAFAISTYQTTTSLSANPTSTVVGQQVGFSAAVVPATAGGGSPAGNVEFLDGTTPITSCGGVNGTALNGGDATCQVTYASPGNHEITASYLGGGGFSVSTSGSVGLIVSPRSATVSAFSATGSPATYGAETSLQFSATVTAGDSGSFPSGDTVSVTHGATPICTISLSTISGNTGSGSCRPSSGTVLPAGTYTNGITATFNSSGADPNFLTAAPVTTSVTIKQATPTITWATPAAITYGTALSATQLDAKASVPGTFVYSQPAGTVLQPGSQTLSATFTPTDTSDYTTATATTTISVGFTQACVTTTVNGSLSIANGQVVCIGSGGKVTGSVSVAKGGALWVSSGTIGGSLSASGALGLTLCGTKVTGSVSVTASSGPVLMGASGCAGDTVGGSTSITGNLDGLSFEGDHVTGSLSISSNRGGATISGNVVTGSVSASSNSGGLVMSGNTIDGSVSVSSNSGGVAFTDNTVYGSLAITNNTGGFTYSGNTVYGSVTKSGNS